MLDNPGSEVYFGEVYRWVLQEAWLPDGASEWSIVGKSRRGSRPTQRGITGPHVSPDQETVRRWFSECATAWRALPWEIPPGASCDNRHGKKWWMEEKARRGLMCSYYDLFIRYCLRFSLDFGCIPPADYLLSVEPVLTDIECNKVYNLSFPNKCGEISMVSGEGEFVSPSDWVSPKCGSEGVLCFKDANGSFGSTTYKFSALYTCIEFIWPDVNPIEIDPDVSKPVYVSGGVPPYHWEVLGTGFSVAQEWTDNPFNSLYASPSACGTAHITVTDICGNVVTGHVLCSAGDWVLITSGVCVLSGSGVETVVDSTTWNYVLIDSYRKQTQTTKQSGGGSCHSWEYDPATYCTPSSVSACGPDSPANCIDGNENHVFPFLIYVYDYCPTLQSFRCFCVSDLKYYEWGCP